MLPRENTHRRGNYHRKNNLLLGGSPGPVVMGRDSYSKGRGFDSRRRKLDGHFSHLFVLKIVKFV